MTNETRTIYVTLSADEARQRWERSASALASIIPSATRNSIELHFIPATGGCVIAAIPRQQMASANHRFASLTSLVHRLPHMQSPVNLEGLGRALLEEAGQLQILGKPVSAQQRETSR